MPTKYRVQNPKTNEIVESFDFITDDELEQALSTANDTFKGWREKIFDESAEVLRKVASLFDEKRSELCNIIAEEMGKSVFEGDGEVDDVVDIFNYYADNGAEFGADEEIPNNQGGTSIIRKVPLGIIVGIMPWNFPYYQVARFAAPALMAGNVVMVKHAEICPRSAAAIEKIFDEAGAPKGLYTNVYAQHSQISTMIEDDRVQGVSLTGSETAGRAIASQAGQALKKCVLELGGTDAYLVLDSSDVNAAAETAWQKRVGNVGQACTANKRMIVMEDLYDDFVDELVQRSSAMQPGDPTSRDADVYGPLSSESAADGLAEQIAAAKEAGATVHVGGERVSGPEGEGFYVSPAVITDVDQENPAYTQELFGMASVVYKVSSAEEAVALANDSQYGLGGAVFSTDLDEAKRVAGQLEVGMANVNLASAAGANLPFGGVKRSGFGRELGPMAVDEFANKRLYAVQGPLEG